MKLLPLFMICGCLYGEKLTGWFSDEGCAKGRVEQCLDKGARAVFISEQGKEMLIVTGYQKAKDDLGYHLEITGVRDAAAKTISVESVKRIGEYEGAACARPRKKETK